MRTRCGYLLLVAVLGGLLTGSHAYAQRRPVLAQIAAPHSYYFREMYLPQLTSGPSALTYSPDGRALIYSMQGRLWRQNLDSAVAEQLTQGAGYDYQPDWSPDGRTVVFARYQRDAIELMRLDLATLEVTPLTQAGAVNLEPRWSPDGTRIAWVSTAADGLFHVYVGEVTAAGLQGAQAWPTRVSAVPRYYYAATDHELSPTWSPDGRELIYITNPEVIYGSGGLWRRSLGPDSTPVPVRLEETTWKARPDWSRDGRRVLYSSYLGRQWHQLWLTTASGGDPLPLTYGDFDVTQARWSPDGTRIAYLSNRDGQPSLWVQDSVGGRQSALRITERRYREPMGRLQLQTLTIGGEHSPARIMVTGGDGRHYAPDDAWMRADDAFDRRVASFEAQYFHSDGHATVTLPAGLATVTVWHGPGYRIETRKLTIAADSAQNLVVTLQPLALPGDWRQRWRNADVHTHMNYAGLYRNTSARLVQQAAAEDVDVVFDLIVNKEQRIPDIGYFQTAPDAASTPRVLLSHGQEYHTGYWGHLGLLGLQDHYLLPDYAAYRNTGAASLFPTNVTVADLAHAQGALVGHVHPFDLEPDPVKDPDLTHSLPIDVALGKIDYYEVLGFSDHRASTAVWYRLLNCGFRVAAAAGTDAMANFASMRGPIGLNRVYVLTDESAGDPTTRLRAWLAGLRAGHSLATNGPLLGLEIDGQPPGGEVELESGKRTLRYRGFLRSQVPIDHLELVQNGRVLRRLSLSRDRQTADFDGQMEVTGPGWVLLRAVNDAADPLIFDSHPYATTTPVYLVDATRPPRCGADADYFLAWIDRVRAAAAAHPDYNTPEERATTLAQIDAARAVMAARR